MKIYEAMNWNETMKEKQNKFDESLVDFVAETGVSFNVLGTTAFKNVIQVANRKLIVKTPKTISNYICNKEIHGYYVTSLWHHRCCKIYCTKYWIHF